MGFWGNLGRGLVKVGKVAVPIALGATGVGAPFAAMAGGGLSALDTKLSGGNWKDALTSGAAGAATGYMGGKLGGFTRNLGSKFSGGGGISGMMKGMGAKAGDYGGEVTKAVGRGIGPWGIAGIAGAAGLGGALLGRAGRGNQQQPQYGYGAYGPFGIGMPGPYGYMGNMDGMGPSIARGQQEALMNQPWRFPQPPQVGGGQGPAPEMTEAPEDVPGMIDQQQQAAYDAWQQGGGQDQNPIYPNLG